jgi:hypothetical protein
MANSINKPRFNWSLWAFILCLSVLFIKPALGDPITVTGFISNASGAPIPGLTVFVSSGDYKSPQSVTNSAGFFQVNADLKENTPSYYLEIYWGDEVKNRQLFRKPFNGQLWGTTNGILNLGQIRLGR